MYVRAEAHRLIGELDKSETLHKDASDLRRRNLGKEHPLYAKSQYSLADLYKDKGELEMAEQLYVKMYECV